MTFDKTGFMTQKRHEAEMALGQPITGDDWETGSVFCPAGNVFEALQDAGKKERHRCFGNASSRPTGLKRARQLFW